MEKNTREQHCHWESMMVPSRPSSGEAENGAEVRVWKWGGNNQERPPR